MWLRSLPTKVSLFLAVWCLVAADPARPAEASDEFTSQAYVRETADDPGPEALADTPDFTRMSGEELVQALLKKETLSRAFYELGRRQRRWERLYETYEEFREFNEVERTVVCPQGEGEAPIYLVLRKRRPYREEYDKEHYLELFGVPGERFQVHAFTAEGVVLTSPPRVRTPSRPLGPTNQFEIHSVDNTIIADMNGDGLVEVADDRAYGLEKRDGEHGTADVLTVEPVRRIWRQEDRIFPVVYNWGPDPWRDWSYAFTDRDGDELIEIELGPAMELPQRSKVTFRWDEHAGTFVGPKGGDSDHFRVIDAKDIYGEIKRLEAEGTTFPPPSPGYEAETAAEKAKPEKAKPKKAERQKVPPTPYRYASLRDLSHAELFRYMGQPEREPDPSMEEMRERFVPTQVCADFWDRTPKEAALATAEVNRGESHRAEHRLAVDDVDGQEPPDVCTVITSWATLRVDPEGAYLAYAGMSFGYCSMRYCELTYAEARHVAHVIWWLNRVRSHTPDKWTGASNLLFDVHFSRRGYLYLLWDGGRNCHAEGTVRVPWSVSYGWLGHYTRDIFLLLANHVLRDALPQRLGDRWSRCASVKATFNDFQRRLMLDVEGKQDIQAMCSRFLDLFSLDERRLSLVMTEAVARIASEVSLPGLNTRLREIRDALPTPEEEDPEQGPQDGLESEDSDRASHVAQLRETIDGLLKAEVERSERLKALRIARSRPPGELGSLLVPAFKLAEKEGELGDVDPWLEALAELALRSTSYQDRREVMWCLVPGEEPQRYTSPIVDETLLEILRTEGRGLGLPWAQFSGDSRWLAERTTLACARALLRHAGAEHFEEVLDVCRKSRIGIGTDLLSVCFQMAQQGRPHHRTQLSDTLRSAFERSDWGAWDLLWAAWSADAHGLKGRIEGLATAGPDEPESYPTPLLTLRRRVAGRRHLARKIAALWNEEDPVARTKLLIAFWIGEADSLTSNDWPDRMVRMETALREAADALDDEQREQVEDFLLWYERTQVIPTDNWWARKSKMETVNRIRDVAGLPQFGKVPADDE